MELIDDDLDLSPYLSAPPDHNKIVPASSFLQQVIDSFDTSKAHAGFMLPWKKTWEDIRIRPHELSIWAGVNGHGKSILLNQVILSLLQQQQKACIASFEMRPSETMGRMARQASGSKAPLKNEIEEFLTWTDNRLWIYDRIGRCDHETVFAVLRYCVETLGIEHFVIDSLVKCGLGVDDYNAQKNFIDALSTYAKDTACHIHLVAHSRKRDTEFGKMGKFDIKGAGEISDLADNVFLVSRNKRKEEEAFKPDPKPEFLEQPDCFFRCEKQRHSGQEGTYGLWFDRGSQQFRGSRSGAAVKMRLDNG